MIERYREKAISTIWQDDARFAYFLQVEIAILQALEETGRIPLPRGTAEKVAKDAKIKLERIRDIEKVTKHDIIAFCTSIAEQLPPNMAKFFHFGVTSSDIIDTALSLQLKDSLQQIFIPFKKLLHTLHRRALETKEFMAMGRSHGMNGEPISFGQKLLGHYCEFARRYRDLKDFYQHQLTAQFSGAMGHYTIVTFEEEILAAKKLGLEAEVLSTQVIPRDRLAKLISLNALSAGAIERLAVEIRHLHHSDIGEVEEGQTPGQKGSSIMPHKKNPIAGENLTGIARTLRSHLSMALDNIVLWHERDISHSSAERLYLPDNLGLFYYSLKRLEQTLERLVFKRKRMEDKVLKSSDYLASYYLHQLICQTNLGREELYPLLQQAAFSAQEGTDTFEQKINEALQEKKIAHRFEPLEKRELQKIYLAQINKVFARAEKKYPLPSSDQ